MTLALTADPVFDPLVSRRTLASARAATRAAVTAALALSLASCVVGSIDGAVDPDTDPPPVGSSDGGGTETETAIAIGFRSAAETIWEGTGTWPIEVDASAAPAVAVSIEYRVVGGTAGGDGVDYMLASGTLTFPAGQTSARILVPIVDDGAAEPIETVEIMLVEATGIPTGEIMTHTLTILDDDDRRWPGDEAVVTVDAVDRFGVNLSGLTYEPAGGGQPAVMWAVKNDPSVLYRIEPAGELWTPTTSGSWSAGKSLRFPDGTGSPDAEGVTRAEAGSATVYVATERDNDEGDTNRLSVLGFDTAAAGASLTATHEWNLTADLPQVEPNLGLEAITWIPDSLLVAHGFHDERRAQPYDPASYPGHGTGLFLVGLEATGTIYVYALDHVGGGALRVASFASGHPALMALELDRDSGYLWTACDNTCDGELAILAIDTNPSSASHGRFVVRRRVSRPRALPDLNNEGIEIAPDTECVDGRKAFFWTDDSATDGHALRRGSIPCGTQL